MSLFNEKIPGFKTIQNSTLTAFYILYIFDLLVFLFSTLRLLIRESRSLEQLSEFLIFDFFRITLFVVIFNGILLYFLSKRFRIPYMIVLGLNIVAILNPIHHHPRFITVTTFTNTLEIIFLLINWNNFTIFRHSVARWKRALIYFLATVSLVALYVFAGFNLLSHSLVSRHDFMVILRSYTDNLFSTSQIMYQGDLVTPKNTLGRLFLYSITYIVWVLLLPIMTILFEKQDARVSHTVGGALNANYNADQDPAHFGTIVKTSNDSLAAFRLQSPLRPIQLNRKASQNIEHKGAYAYAARTRNCLINLGNLCVYNHEDQAMALKEFETCALQNSTIPVLFQASGEWNEIAKKAGWHTRQMGIEAIVDTQLFDLSLPKYKKLRNSHTAFRKASWDIRIVSLGKLSEDEVKSVDYLKQVWLGVKDRKDLGFSMNMWPIDSQVTGYLALAIHPIFGVSGAFSFLYFEQDGVPGLSLDLFYTNPYVKSSLTEGLLIEAILAFKSLGIQYISLGLVPNMTMTKKTHTFSRITNALLGSISGYDSHSLFVFKKKFATHWLDKYIIVRGLDSLPLALRDISQLINKAKQ